jgi:hypothetical protein
VEAVTKRSAAALLIGQESGHRPDPRSPCGRNWCRTKEVTKTCADQIRHYASTNAGLDRRMATNLLVARSRNADNGHNARGAKV